MQARAPEVPAHRAATLAALGAGLLGAGIACSQLAWPGRLTGVTEYDDGVYLAATLHLVHGSLPYRDFAFVQPPGILVLMSPVGLIGRVLGARDALALARVVTMLVAGANAALVALLVRRRGALAMAVAGGALATFPLAVTADHTLLLEPYLVACVLAGTLLATGTDAPSWRRLALAGACFGLAGAVKTWAIVPMLALAAYTAAREGRRVLALVGGCVAAFSLVCLPFVVAAPAAAFHDVVVAQLDRTPSAPGALSIGARLVAITGIGGLPGVPSSPALAAALLVGLAALAVVTAVAGRRSWSALDSLVVASAAAEVAALLVAPDFYPHYAYFSAPMLAASLAVALSGALDALRRRARAHARRRSRRPVALATIGLAVAAVLAGENVAYGETYLPSSVRTPAGAVLDPGRAIARAVPAGACALSDDPVLLVEADRLLSSRPGCPSLVDPVGMRLAAAAGAPPRRAAESLASSWRSAFARASFVVLSSPSAPSIGWSAELRRWFAGHFRLVLGRQAAYVYERAGAARDHTATISRSPSRPRKSSGLRV